MEPEDNEKAFSSFLESSRGSRWLEDIARSVGHAVREGWLPFEVWPYEAKDLEGAKHEIIAILGVKWDKLKNKPELQRALREYGNEDQRAELRRVFTRSVLNHLKDKARTGDSWRAAYRNARQTLSSAPGIHTKTEKSRGGSSIGTYFSLDPDAPVMSRESLKGMVEDYRGWTFPWDFAPDGEFRRRKRILALAENYWRQACERLGGPRFLPVSGLLDWITTFLIQPAGGLSNTMQLDDEQHSVPDPSPDRPTTVDDAKLDALAEALVFNCNDKIRTALWLRWGEGLELEEIALRMGYSSPSGAHYTVNMANQAVRKFCLAIPELCPPDYDEELFLSFMEKVVDICKASTQGRYS